MTMQKEITTTLNEIKALYNEAVSNNANTLTLHGTEILTSYAKYMIQYIETLTDPEDADKPIVLQPTN